MSNKTFNRACLITIILLIGLAGFFIYEIFFNEEYAEYKDEIKEERITNDGNYYSQTVTIDEYMETTITYFLDAEARLCYVIGSREITVIPCSNLARKKDWNKIIDW